LRTLFPPIRPNAGAGIGGRGGFTTQQAQKNRPENDRLTATAALAKKTRSILAILLLVGG